jgi:hypothetical protein
MNDDLVKQAIAELTDVVRCRCNEAYTGRGLHDPDCECDSAEAVKVVADRIEELEAKLSKSEALLAKAVEAERVYCANVVKHFYDNGFFTKPDEIINRTTLAELKGQEDE